MTVGEKHNQKNSKVNYKKLLDKNDPFDQLIMELGQKGVLDICAVEVHEEPQKTPRQEYNRKPIPPKGKHTS